MLHGDVIFQRLLDLNNLHSVMAVLSALQSAPVYRLVKTWSVRKYRHCSDTGNDSITICVARGRLVLRWNRLKFWSYLKILIVKC